MESACEIVVTSVRAFQERRGYREEGRKQKFYKFLKIMTKQLTKFITTIINTIFRSIVLAHPGNHDSGKNKNKQQQPNTMKNVKLNLKKARKAGFSLVEMLVVIAVIGVIAAIAIPNIGNINDSARNTTAQRNAQSCASVYSAGIAAGCPAAADEAAALTALASGTWAPTSGAFSGKVFMVPNLPTAVTDADAHDLLTDYLAMDGNGYLNYNSIPVPD